MVALCVFAGMVIYGVKRKKYMRLRALAQSAKYVAALSVAALTIEAVGALGNNNLSWTDRLGRIAGAMFAFASTSIAISAAAVALGATFAAIIGLIFAVSISLLLNRFYSLYLSRAVVVRPLISYASV